MRLVVAFVLAFLVSAAAAEPLFRTSKSKPDAKPAAEKKAEAPPPVRSAFAGDDALMLAGERFGRTTKEHAVEAFNRIAQQLQLSAESRGRYAHIAVANFRKSARFAEFDQLSETILVAAKAVKIGTAKNVMIISNSHVDIAFAEGVVVIAAGSISVSHELAAAGIYVSRGPLTMSHGLAPMVYAVAGADAGHSSPTAYNTDVHAGSGRRVVNLTRAPLFRNEPLRAPAPPTMTVDSGESLPVEGQRCKTQLTHGSIMERLPYVRRDSDCPRLTGAKVRCEQEGGDRGAFRERWTFSGCGSSFDFLLTVDGNTNAIGRAPPAAAAAPVFIPPGGKAGEDRAVLYNAAVQHLLRGEQLEGRAKYQAVLALTPNDPSAISNIASVDRVIARADAGAAPYSKAIDAGRATARDYATRGLVYIKFNDTSRGLKDLRRATEMNNSDPQLRVDLARGYLLADRPGEAHGVAHDVTAYYPKHTGAYEVSAWASLLSGSPDVAYKAAFSSLVEAGNWTKKRFADEKAAYRVMAGYFALRACGLRPRANTWTRQWTEFMQAEAWPDALALQLVGDMDEGAAIAVAAALRPKDEGLALAEAHTYLALEEVYAATGERRREAMRAFYREGYSAGRTLPWVLSNRLNKPGQRPRARGPTEAKCFDEATPR